MQKYTYHTHNSFGGLFDGWSSCEEMISTAENKGFEEIGVSNHLIYHPNVPNENKMYYNDINKIIDVHKRSFEEIDKVASNHSIKVYKGLEVDFFPSLEWRKDFEKIIKELNPDYLIGSTHFIRTADETRMYNIYHLDCLPANTSKEDMKELLTNYWLNIIGAVKSGYFNFIAHIDYCTQFNLCTEVEWNDLKYSVIETIKDKKQPFEINTGGIDRIGRPYPDWWIAEELIKLGVPVIISDDAHGVERIGDKFPEVEDFLDKVNCKNRYKF